MPIKWKDDGFFLHVEAKDMVTGETYWRRADSGDVKMIVDAAVAAERERCCSIVFGQASSDNTAQRTVDAIRGISRRA